MILDMKCDVRCRNFEETEGEGQKFKVESLKFKEEARKLEVIKNLELEIKNSKSPCMGRSLIA